MKWFIALFLVVTSVEFIDSRDDASKTYIILKYDSGQEDKLILDKKDLTCHTCIWNAVNKVLDERKAY
jgi:hypothetical protein